MLWTNSLRIHFRNIKLFKRSVNPEFIKVLLGGYVLRIVFFEKLKIM